MNLHNNEAGRKVIIITLSTLRSGQIMGSLMIHFT